MDDGRIVGDVDYRGKPRVQTINNDASMTITSDAHLADIHNIMAQFSVGGLDALDQADLMFRDVSEFTDLADALNQAKLAEVQFMKLPSKVREIFDHDVAVWLDTAHDKEKRDALVDGGFLDPERGTETIKAPPAPAPIPEVTEVVVPPDVPPVVPPE